MKDGVVQRRWIRRTEGSMDLNALDSGFSMSRVDHSGMVDAVEVWLRKRSLQRRTLACEVVMLTFTRFVPAGAGILRVDARCLPSIKERACLSSSPQWLTQ